MPIDPSQISPVMTAFYGVQLQTKRRGILISQGQSATIQFQMLDRVGNPVDITQFVDDPDDPGTPLDDHVELHIREAMDARPENILTVACTVTDMANGLIECTAPADVVNNPGVYLAEFGVYKAGPLTDVTGAGPAVQCPDLPDLAFTNQAFVWVDRGLFGCPTHPAGGPPNVEEIRLFIRDNAPEENLLLEDFEFDLADMCEAAVMAVRYWNEAQPPIDLMFNTVTYPAKFWWIHAISGYLFLFAAQRFRRNTLPYQAGGLAVNDQDKEAPYTNIGLNLIRDYREWVKMKKAQINAESAITAAGSSYSLHYMFNL